MIGDPLVRYREDPVRMMRAVRIAAKLGFTMDKATERAIPKMARTLENVPAARLFDEVMKLFTSGHAEDCLLKLRTEGLHRSLLPMLDVILDEEEGEKFLMLALRRTDERIAVGKKISPSFLFATLLWPQVKKRWDAYQQNQGMIRSRALYAAADDVIATQCQKLAIQHRFVADIKLIWMLQLRFERCTGKNPYTLVEHPKYRAGYDFMLLRSLLGHIPSDLVRWWENFAQADADARAVMIADQERAARRTASKARAGNRRRREEADLASEEALLSQVEQERENAAPRRSRRAKSASKQSSAFSEQGAAAEDLQPSAAAKPRRRRKSAPAKSADSVEGMAAQAEGAPELQEDGQLEQEPVKRRRRRRKPKPKIEDVLGADHV